MLHEGTLASTILSQTPSARRNNNMLVKTNSVILALGIVLTVFCGNVYAQKTVYKWVDEDGVVHFSAEPPSESPDVQVKLLFLPLRRQSSRLLQQQRKLNAHQHGRQSPKIHLSRR
jgi:hypothetical protein